jgi:hypothetical protein
MHPSVNQETVNDTAKLIMHRLIARLLSRDPLLIDRARIALNKNFSSFSGSILCCRVGTAASLPNWRASHAADQPQPAHETFAPVVSVRDGRRRGFFQADSAAADQAGRKENCDSLLAPGRRKQSRDTADISLMSAPQPVRRAP